MDSTITTGVPWLDKTIAVLAAIGAICSLLSHVVSPTTGFGKIISWGALNFGKQLSKPSEGPVTELRPPRGYARLVLLVVLAAGCLLSFAAHAAAEAPGVIPVLPQVAQSDPKPDPAPSPSLFGGCTASGKLCFAPSIAISIAAVNLSTQQVEGAFSPGVGYGFTFNPGKWSSVGADLYFIMSPAANQASGSILAKFFNGYVRVGVSKGLLGDKSTRILVGPGIDIP